MKLLCTMQAVLAIASAALAPAAQSYIVVDNQTGMILASKKPNDKLQVASLTKIATAMVALDWAQLSKADLSQMAVISPRAVRAGGINPVGLQEGDSLSCAIFSILRSWPPIMWRQPHLPSLSGPGYRTRKGLRPQAISSRT
jgi:D-alanyl-D-alanine carboxypeptidase